MGWSLPTRLGGAVGWAASVLDKGPTLLWASVKVKGSIARPQPQLSICPVGTSWSQGPRDPQGGAHVTLSQRVRSYHPGDPHSLALT